MQHILILEDDSNHLELLTEVIKFGGHEAYPVSNSKMAREILSKKNIDLIITDISLTNETGLDFISQLKMENVNIPFIVVSGSTDIKDKQMAESLNALSFIKKPVDPETLLKLIKRSSL